MTKQATPMQRAKSDMLIWLCAVFAYNFTTGNSVHTKNHVLCGDNWMFKQAPTGKRLQKMKHNARKKIRASGISIQREYELFHSINGRLQSGLSNFDFGNIRFCLIPKDMDPEHTVCCPLTGLEFQCIPGNSRNAYYEIDVNAKYLWTTHILAKYLAIVCSGIDAILYFPATITQQIIIYIDVGMCDYGYGENNATRLTFDQTATVEHLTELQTGVTDLLAQTQMQPFADTLLHIKPISNRRVEFFFSGSTVCAATVFEAASLIRNYLVDMRN
jgi:hypothetical protein